MRITNSNRLNTVQKKALTEMLNYPSVNDYHKTLLKGIKDNSDKKNLSNSDISIFIEIAKNYYIEDSLKED